MIIGGIAVIARGVPRDTTDVDAAVWAEGLDPSSLLGVLSQHVITPRIAESGPLPAAGYVVADTARSVSFVTPAEKRDPTTDHSAIAVEGRTPHGPIFAADHTRRTDAPAIH